MKKTIMKVMALLLAVVLMLPSSLVFAATGNNSQQITNAGGKHETYDNIAEDPIEISKTLSHTENENYLNMDLEIKTKENIKNLYDSVAVVLVLDASNTMNSNGRVESATEAISEFIKNYYSNSFNASNKYLGIVVFNTHAQTCAELKDYSQDYNSVLLDKENGKLSNFVKIIKDSEYKDSHERFTNIEAGLLLADNLLTKSGEGSKAMHKFIVLATDGFPTTYCYREGHDGDEHGAIGRWTYEPSHITDIANVEKIRGYCPYMSCNSNSCYHGANDASWGDPGYFANGFADTNDIYCRDSSCGNTNGTYADGKYHAHNRPNLKCDHGTNYSDWAAWAAEGAANYIKNKGTNIYSIGIDIGGQTIHDYLEKDLNNIKGVVRENKPTLYFSTMEFPKSSVDPIIGFAKNDYENWLGKDVGGSKYLSNDKYFIEYDSSKQGNEKKEQIKRMFDTISTFVTNVKSASSTKWVISDPIPQPFEFLEFINANGAKYDKNTEKITWNLKEMNVTADQNGVYTYSMSYKIRVKTEKDGFVSEKTYNTNGTTDFIWDEWNDTDKKWEGRSTEFPIPKAQGYLGSLEFTKVDSADNTKTVPGASFKLSHNSNCSVCANAIAAGNISGNVAISDMTATSGSDGKVSFTKIPSGHEYTLTEISPANGYQEYDVKHNVTVSYGKTFVDGKPADAFAEIKNVKIQPSEDNIVFSVKKTADGSTPADKEFEFVLKEGNTEIDRIAVRKGQTASFDKIVYSEWSDIGSHTYTVTEVIPEGANAEGYTDDYAYDKTVYTAEVNVEVNDEGNRYVASVVSFKGPNGDVNSAANFNNDYLDPASIEFKVKKTVDNSEKTGTFKFELKDNGTVIKTIEITGNGSGTFGAIEFDSLDKLGTHIYTISEVVPEDAVDGNTDEIAYDRTVYTKIVDVRIDGTKYIVSEEGGRDFENGETFEYYFKNEYLDPAEVVLEVSKTIENEISDDMKFSFVITDEDGNILKDEDGNDYVVIVDKNNPRASFKPLVYNELKDILDENGNVITHIYKIREVIPEDAVDGNTDEIAYDTEVYTVTVEAGINAERTAYYAKILDFEDSSNNDVNIAAFENKFLDPAEVLFTVDKKRDEKAPDDDEFKFVLREKIDGDFVDIQTITVTGSKKAFFDPIVYNKISQLGDHTYVVCEIIPEGGMDTEYVYSDAVYERTINVAIDSNRTFYVVTDKNGEPYDGETFEFYNEYLDPTEVQFTAKKTLEGTGKISDGIFSFVLMNEEGKVLETAKNIGNTVTFGKIVYKEPGTHKYTIMEIRGDDTSILYDKAVYEVTVDVIYKTDEDGRKIGYETEITYKENKKEAEEIVFENILREPAEVVLKAKKTVNGVKPGDLSYTFNLRDSEGNIVDTAKNNGDGEIVFDTLSFNKEGTYYYTISEKPFYSEEMHYDRTVYDVKIIVTADENTEDPFEAEVIITERGKREQIKLPIFKNRDRDPIVIDGKDPSDPGEEYNPSTGAPVFETVMITAGNKVFLPKKREDED